MNSVCFNCVTYRWPTEGVPVFRCKKCKFAYYCSPQCQEEHWVKVHKKQCKTLAGKVEVPVSTHLPDSCLGCKEEKELGTKKLDSQDCPVWGCLMERKNTKCFVGMGVFPSAVELGEMARRFSTRTEHTVYMMQLILNKMTRTKSRLAKECKAEMTSLAEFLARKRDIFTRRKHLFPTNAETRLADGIKWFEELKEAGFPAISTISSKLGTKAGDPFCAWETFKLLVGFLCFSGPELFHKNFDNINMKEELPREVKELFDQRDTYTQFEELWDKVLAALDSGLVDYSSLVEIVCGGSRHQECDHCKKPVIIEQVVVLVNYEEEMFKKPFVTGFGLRIFSCLEMDCRSANVNQRAKIMNETSAVILSKVLALQSNICDYCYMIGKKVHRCSDCMTKVYCSEECQLLDWNLVHGKICNKGEEVHLARKVKGGKKQRESAGKKNVDEFASQVAEFNPFDQTEPYEASEMCHDAMFVNRLSELILS